ncbi:hypothetical protein GOC31_20880 [Sinorhizobium meliloti]|nr:hypothetical protein [Sinorhizobium meliloti]
MSDNQNSSGGDANQTAVNNGSAAAGKKASKAPVAKPARPSIDDIKAMGLDPAPYGDQPKKKG